MKKKLQVIPSGIPLVDLAWGGFYRGGTYFLSGPRKSGRTILALQYSLQAMNDRESCLYFSSFRPKDLLINAAAIDIDLQDFINRNLFTLVRVTLAKNIENTKEPDSYLKEYIRDLKTVVDQYQPSRIVFDELTQFIGFKDINLLKESFLETIEYIEDSGITSLLVLSEPATPAAYNLSNALISLSTGYISLEKSEKFVNKLNPGIIKIVPNVGHVEGEFSSSYFIEPHKGVQTDFKPVNDKTIVNSLEDNNKINGINILQVSSASTSFYSPDDFKLLLNNQIAYFKETNQTSTLASIRLSAKAEEENLLTVNQLANAIRLSIDKKDKICILKNVVFVIFTKQDRDINSIISVILNNLPDNSPAYLNRISSYIILHSLKIYERTQNADSMLKELLAADFTDKNNLGLN